jgi:hypothetical protein
MFPSYVMQENGRIYCSNKKIYSQKYHESCNIILKYILIKYDREMDQSLDFLPKKENGNF